MCAYGKTCEEGGRGSEGTADGKNGKQFSDVLERVRVCVCLLRMLICPHHIRKQQHDAKGKHSHFSHFLPFF